MSTILLWLSLFACSTVFADSYTNGNTNSTDTTSTTEEDEGFSKWDGIGLAVSITTLLFCIVFCYCKEIACKEDEHHKVPKSPTAIGGEVRPNDEVVPKIHRDIWKLLDEDQNGLIDFSELAAIFGDRSSELLEKYDWDRTGDLSLFELSRIFENEFSEEFTESVLLDLQKKSFGKNFTSGTVPMSRIDALSKAQDVHIDVTTRDKNVGGDREPSIFDEFSEPATPISRHPGMNDESEC